MFETYRMLGAQREAELLAEAERLHRGRRFRQRDSAEPTVLGRLARGLRRGFLDARPTRRPELQDKPAE